MLIPFLFTLGLCLLTTHIDAHPLQMDEPIPHEKHVHIQCLSNGIKIYIRENESPSESVSFRIMFRSPSYEEVQYSFNGRLDSMDEIEQFFTSCKKPDDPRVSPLRMNAPEEMAIIAVGNFLAQDMQNLIEKHFGDLILLKESDSSQILVSQDETISKVALRVSYPNQMESIKTYQDLKEVWKFLLLQELFQQRLEHCSRGLDEAWIHPHPRFFYPVNGYAFVEGDAYETLLSLLLWQAETISSNGFFEDEFDVVKRNMISKLQYLGFNASHADHAFLASYYADQFLLGDACFCHHSFLNASAELVKEIQFEDLFPYIPSFLLDNKRQVQVVYPKVIQREVLTRERIEELIDHVADLASFYRDSEIPEDSFWVFDTENTRSSPRFKNGSQKEDKLSLCKDAPFDPNQVWATELFYQLPLTDKEKRLIASIITTMSEKNIVLLALDKHSLEKKGKQIHHVHPLRFAGYILSSTHLKDHLKIIKKSTFKWDAFISGFSKRMREELANENVYPYVDGFAEQVGSTPDHVKRFVHKKDFEGLIRSLL